MNCGIYQLSIECSSRQQLLLLLVLFPSLRAITRQLEKHFPLKQSGLPKL